MYRENWSVPRNSQRTSLIPDGIKTASAFFFLLKWPQKLSATELDTGNEMQQIYSFSHQVRAEVHEEINYICLLKTMYLYVKKPKHIKDKWTQMNR